MQLIKLEPANIWDPFSDIWDMRKEINGLVNNMFVQPQERTAVQGYCPPVDIYEEKKAYIVKAELPGMNQNDTKVSINDNVLTIKGERKPLYDEETRRNYQRLERGYGSFSRSFRLPRGVKADQIEAKYVDGVLELSIPKADQAKEREISIKVE